jgi:TolB-like protein
VRARIVLVLSAAVLVTAAVWLVFEPGPEPLLAALAAAIAIVSQRRPRAGDIATLRSALVSTPGGRQRPAIVVLPFENVSPDPENEYFVDGLTAEITADLSALRSLQVISRTSAMTMKGTSKDLRTIGTELGVRYVLEGTVRKSADRLRITAQLVDAESDGQLWADKYHGDLADVFRMQEDVSTAIARALKLELTPADTGRLESHPVSDPRAYELYLRARGEYGRQNNESLERAMRHLNSAPAIVGDNALLYSSLGQTHALYGSLVLGADVHREHLDLAEGFARKALTLAPESPRAHGLLGFILYDRFETGEGLSHMEEAAEAASDDCDNLSWAVLTFSMCAKDEKASRWARLLLEADPLNALTQFMVGEHHLLAGRFDEAEAHFRRARELDPEGPNSRTSLGQLLAYTGRADEAIDVLDVPEEQLAQHLVWDVVGQAIRFALRGDRERARSFLTPELHGDAKSDMLFSWLLADCYALLDEPEQALKWLGNAVAGGFLNRAFFSEHDPWLAALRHEPDFRSVMERLDASWNDLTV